MGSPPQVRGKPRGAIAYGGGLRITPAGAGKTSDAVKLQRFAGDHPRRCGENWTAIRTQRCFPGSPPQVRGKPQCHRVRNPPAGITPAGAGKTGFTEVTGDDAKDHPRRCGENQAVRKFLINSDGSPPQVRGKLSRTLPAS